MVGWIRSEGGPTGGTTPRATSALEKGRDCYRAGLWLVHNVGCRGTEDLSEPPPSRPQAKKKLCTPRLWVFAHKVMGEDGAGRVSLSLLFCRFVMLVEHENCHDVAIRGDRFVSLFLIQNQLKNSVTLDRSAQPWEPCRSWWVSLHSDASASLKHRKNTFISFVRSDILRFCKTVMTSLVFVVNKQIGIFAEQLSN